MVHHLLQGCLYFTANSLARVLTGIAEEEFKKTGLAPNYAFIILLICEKPGLMQKEISEYLQLTPSTITRFVDKLETKKLLARRTEGKAVFLDPTEEGKALLGEIKAAWERLYYRYADVLGTKMSQQLTEDSWKAALRLEGK